MRRFPIMLGNYGDKRSPRRNSSIPWEKIAPHEAQAQHNHSQSLETLASRGGLGAEEAVSVMRDLRWRDCGSLLTEAEAIKQLEKLVGEPLP